MPCVWLPNGVILNVREEAFKRKSFMKFLDRVRKKAQKGCGTTWPEPARILESCSESPDAKIELIEDKGFLNDNDAEKKSVEAAADSFYKKNLNGQDHETEIKNSIRRLEVLPAKATHLSQRGLCYF